MRIINNLNYIKMDKIKEVQDRLERGYTMAVYGSSGGIHEQMTSDIKILLEALTLGDVSNQRELLLSGICQFTKRNKQSEILDVSEWLKTYYRK